MSLKYRLIVIHGMGFRQHWGHVTGMEEVWAESRRHSSSDVWVMPPMPWDSNVKATAALIARHATVDTILVGRFYSWGGGWFFPRLARELDKHCLGFRDVCLADPVFRNQWLPACIPINPRSLMNLFLAPRIIVPENVENVYWTRQRENRPQAHDLVAQGKHTVIHTPIVLHSKHTEMDSHPAYLRLCRESLESCLGVLA